MLSTSASLSRSGGESDLSHVGGTSPRSHSITGENGHTTDINRQRSHSNSHSVSALFETNYNYSTKRVSSQKQ